MLNVFQTNSKSVYVTAMSAVAVLLLAEATARLLAPKLPVEPGKWPRPELAAKYDQMRQYAEKGEGFDLVFVGSSMTMNGIDPVIFSERAGLRAYNAAFAAGSPRTVALWTLDIVEPLLSPDILVYGISARDFNDNGKVQRDIYKGFTSSPGYRQVAAGVEQRAEGLLEHFSVFMRYRRYFRSPGKVLRDLTEEKRPGKDPKYGSISQFGRREPKPGPYKIRKHWKRNQISRVLNDFSMGADELTALSELHADLERRGVQMVLLSMPMSADYGPLLPHGERDLVEYRRMISEFTDAREIPIIDAENAATGFWAFRDPVHLDIGGRRALTEELAAIWDDVDPGQERHLEIEIARGPVASVR
jgi:hypothetical protein